VTRPLLALIACLVAAAPVTAGGLRDLEDAWLIPSAEAGALLDAGATRASGWSLSLAQGRLFALEELGQLGLVLGRRWPRASLRFRWERLGQTLYRAACDLRLVARPGRRLRVDVWWPVTAPPPWHGDLGLRRWLRVTAGGQGWSWAAVVDRRASGAPLLQGEVLLRLAPAAALGLRVEAWSGAAGLCTAWRWGQLLLRSSHLVHPDLGTTHRWSVGVGAAP
jgi:hypothetical protein